MNKNKKRNIILAALLLCLTTVLGVIGISTYAKYESQLSNVTQNVTVAKWAFESDNSSHDFAFNLGQNYDENTLMNDRIAPGTKGNLVFSLSNEHTETGVKYQISLNKNNGTPKNLKFYSNPECTTELINGNVFKGTLDPGASATDVIIYWKWEYENGSNMSEISSNDSFDTSNGASATINGMTITATIVGTQIEPTI